MPASRIPRNFTNLHANVRHEQAGFVKLLAQRSGCSESEVVREALDLLIENHREILGEMADDQG